jgi:hypothetical protein
MEVARRLRMMDRFSDHKKALQTQAWSATITFL